MHITQVINNLGTGGAENLVVNLAHELSLSGHVSRIVLLSEAGGIPMQKAQELGLDVVGIGESLRDPRAMRALAKLSRDTDVMHVHLFPSLYFAAFGKMKAPKIYTEHSSTNRRRGKRLYYPVERRAYGSYDRLIAVSTGTQKSLQGHLDRVGLAKEVGMIHNGISGEFFDAPITRTAIPSESVKLLAVGTLDYRKNFSAAIKAVERTAGVTLTIVGSGPDELELKDLIVTKGLKDRIELRPATPNIRQIMDDHDVLLSSSLHEGFPLVVAEALSRGLPVIGPNLPGFELPVTDQKTGLLYEVGSVPAMSAAIESLRDNRAAYLAFSKNALEDRDRFKMRGVASNYVHEYEAVTR